MARISTNVNEKIFNISQWHGVNEASEGEARLRLGEAAVMRNFRVTAGGALKKRPGSRNVAGLLSEYVAHVREGSRRLLMTDTGLSQEYPMYPRMEADGVGQVRARGEMAPVDSAHAGSYTGYFYERDGACWSLLECAVTPGTGSEAVLGGRATAGALAAICTGREIREGERVTTEGVAALDVFPEGGVISGAAAVRGEAITVPAPDGDTPGWASFGVPAQSQIAWGEEERNQRLKATEGSLRLSDFSDDEGWDTQNVGGFVLRDGKLWRYYGAKVDSVTPVYVWKKYKCSRSSYGYTYYREGSWMSGGSETLTEGNSVSGTSSYYFNSSSGTFTGTGGSRNVYAGESGTVYQADGSSITRFTVTRTDSKTSRLTVEGKVAQGPYYGTSTTYSRGDALGETEVREGTNPEADAGYTYVTTFSDGGTQYTVMRFGEDYFCYAKDAARPAVRTERTWSFQGYPLTLSPDTAAWYFAETYATPNEGVDPVVRGLWSGYVKGREVLCAACGGFLWELRLGDGETVALDEGAAVTGGTGGQERPPLQGYRRASVGAASLGGPPTIDQTWTKVSCGNMDTSRDVYMFGFDDKLYILNGVKYQVWDGDTLQEVEGYRPLVSVSVEPAGGGTLLENVNRLTAGKRCWFSPDGSAKVFQLPETGIKSVDWVRDLTQPEVVALDEGAEVAEEWAAKRGGPYSLDPDSIIGLTANAVGAANGGPPQSEIAGGEEERTQRPKATIGSLRQSVFRDDDGRPDAETSVIASALPSYTVDLTAGTVTFESAPAKGVNSVEIGWTGAESFRDQVCAMRFAELYNGAQDSRVFLYGDGSNRALYSGLDHEGRPRADYFPDLYEVSVGDSNTPLTAMIRHYNKLLAFKPDSAWSIGYDTITLVDGTVTAGFTVTPVNRAIGNCAPGQAELVQNRPRTLDGRSVIEWKATGSSGITGDQRNAERVSQRVDQSIRRFDLTLARTFYDKFSHEYYVIGEDGTAIVQNLDVDAWYVYTGLDVTCMINYRDELYYGTRDGYLRHFSDGYFSDNGEAIDARWESGAMSFAEDFRRKYSATVWVGIKPEDNGYLEVTAQTDRKSDFAVYDVATFDAGAVPEMERIKIKAKKFTYYKMVLSCDTADKTVTVVSADIRVRGTGYVR